MMKRAQELTYCIIVRSNLHGDRTLARGRKPLGGLEELLYVLPRIETNQARGSEDCCVHLSLVHFPETRWNVAPKLYNFEVGPKHGQLRPPPKARGTNA